MRDFYDIRMLLDTYEDKVNKAVLKDAFAATCKKRGTDHLQEQAEEIIKIIEADEQLQVLWRAYQKKYSYAADIDYASVISGVRKLMEISSYWKFENRIASKALQGSGRFRTDWKPCRAYFFAIFFLKNFRPYLDIRGLKWSDINWKKRTIHIQRGVVKLSHEESITKDPKTASGDRIVYLSKEMCQLLKSWRKECEWDRKQTADETVSEDDYLFRQTNGKPMNPSTFTFRFKKILKQNGLPTDLNLHSLRHTNASLLIAQGVDVRTVASLLGHAQASTTLDIYAHAFDKNKRKAQEKLGKVIGLWEKSS